MSTAGQEHRPIADAEILAAIHGQIEPVRTSPRYIAGMTLVALVMVLLPLVYLSLIVAVAALLWYHATHSIAVFEQARGRNARGALAIYIGPLVIGGFVLLFMIKPLFAPRRRQDDPVTLDPESEPLLFAFVRKLCGAVHAPAPRQIRVDNEVNASAAFRRGFWSMFGTDLTLTIGLPLAAGMSLRQLSGVLAHEFGHFSQGAGMRLTFVIRSISFWFVRVVYERDSWDEWLTAQGQESGGWLALILLLTRGFVWLTRRILWVLMWVGNLVSCLMLRQMEFDADRHEARFAGSETFQQTARRLAELSVARQMALSDLGRFLDEGRLADDLSALVLANVPQITPEIRKQVLEPIEQAKTGLFDTHPAERDRVASAYLEKAPGIFRLPAPTAATTHPTAERRDAAAVAAAAGESNHVDPAGDTLRATTLFHDFSELSREVTLRFYEEQLERKIAPEEVHPVELLVGSQEIDLAAARTLQRYLQGTVTPLRPIPLPARMAESPTTAEEAENVIRSARERLLNLLDAYRADFKTFDDADTELLAAGTARAFFQAKLGSYRKQGSLKHKDGSAAAAAFLEAEETMQGVAPGLAEFEAVAAERLSVALQLVQDPDACARAELPDDAPQRVARLQLTAHLSGFLVPEVLKLRNELASLSSLLGCVQENEQNASLISAIKLAAAAIRQRLLALREKLAGKSYPFDHAQADMTLDRYVFGFPAGTAFPESDNISQIGSLASDTLNKVFGLYHRSLSHLSVIAEKLEGTLGIEPLAEPAQGQSQQNKPDGDSEVASEK